jgi:predicted amidohydrolase YtcJ
MKNTKNMKDMHDMKTRTPSPSVIAVLLLISFTPFIVNALSTPTQPSPADLVLRHGRIVTVDDRMPEAQALVSSGGRIVAVGSDTDVAKYIGPSTQVIDLGGQLAIPGFIEGHGHFSGIGESRVNLDFMNTKSWDEIVQMVAQAVERAKPGEWIVGRGWHQDKWIGRPEPNVEGFPTHASLDRVSPDNPVVLTHASGHASFVNRQALGVSGITRDTPNPTGGEILKGADGEPTGLLRETAEGLVHRPAPTETETRRILSLADEEVVGKGITTFQDAGSSFGLIDLVKVMVTDKQMRVRLWMMVRASNQALRDAVDRYRLVGYGDNQLTVRAIKVTADGALGSRGAWLLEPYADKLDSTGLTPAAVATLPDTAQIAIDHNLQLCVHAIGDRANREVLNIYEAAFKKNNKTGKDLRWRIEHAQHLSAPDIPRFGQLGVIASMQAIHATSDGAWVPDRLGDKRSEEGAYVWQKLMKSGAVVTNGTDAPVENVDPIPNYYAAVTRKLPNGRVFYPDQRMTRMEALRASTIQNAFAGFEEDIKGSLTVGKLADITVLSKDITTVADEEIKSAKVVYTIVGGHVVYKAR